MPDPITSIVDPGTRRDGLSTIVAALRMMASTTVLTLLFGLATNKLIAELAGPDGLAQLSVYRTLTNMMIAIVSLGMSNVVVQRVSTATSPMETHRVLRGTVQLLIMQVVALSLFAIVLGGPVAKALFGPAQPHLTGTRTALIFAIGVLAMQTTLEVLNGLAAVSRVAMVNLVTSFLTVVTAYPLLRSGELGLGMMMGLTCFVGAMIAWSFVRRIVGEGTRGLLSGPWESLRTLPVSVHVAIRGVACTGALMIFQSTIARRFGTSLLGVYTSASMLETNATALLTAFMRPYYLPTLARLDDAHKHRFANRIQTLLLLLAVAGTLLLVLVAPFLLRFLFSRAFEGGAEYLAVLSVSIIAQTFLYTYGFYFVHHAHFREAMFLDIAWAATLLVVTMACAWTGASLMAYAAGYAATYCAYAASYVIYGRRLYGPGLVSLRNIGFGVAAVAWIGIAYLMSGAPLVARIGFAAGSLAILLGVALRFWKNAT